MAKLKTMRNIFTHALLFICPVAGAQLQKGNINIGTSTNAPLNFQFRSSNAGYKTSDFVLNPTFGYNISDRVEIGAGPVFRYNGIKWKDQGAYLLRNRSYSYGLNLYSRYFLQTKGKLVPYLTGNLQYLRTNSVSYSSPDVKFRYHSYEWQAGAGGGVNWFLSPRSALFAELTYKGNWGNGAGFNSGLDFNIGFRFYPGKKKKHD